MKMGRKRETLLYFCAYTVVFIFMCIIVFWEFWSTGKSFVWRVDGWSQHYRALQFYSDWLQGIVKNIIENHQLVIPLWSKCIGYGSDIITTLHYYVIGDPLCLLSVFVPDKYMVHCYDALIILRLYLAGLALYAFCRCRYIGFKNKREGELSGYHRLDKTKSWKNWIVDTSGMLAATFIYLFSGYVFIMGLHHPYFLNPMIYLPLLLIGAEKIIEKKSPALFIVMVCISAVSNFYFFYMIGCNVIVYMLVRLFTKYGIHHLKEIIRKLLQTAGYTLVGICLSGIILVPVLNLLMRTERMNHQSVFTFFYNTDFYKNLPILFFVPISGITNHTAMAFSFVAFFCVLLLFMERKKNLELKILFFTLTAVICLPLAGKIFHGFSYSSNRWMFGYVLLIAWIVKTEWNRLFFIGKNKLAVIAGLSVAAGCYMMWRKEEAVITVVICATVFLLLGLFFLTVCCMIKEKKYVWLQSVLFLVLVIGSTTGNAFYNFSGKGNGVSYEFKDQTTVRNYLNAPADIAVKKIVGNHAENVRYSGPFYVIERNSTLKSGLMSTHFYWSLADKLPSQFYKEMGMNNKTDYNYRGLDGRTILNSLAAVKYYVIPTGMTEELPYGYVKKGSCAVMAEWGKTNYSVYENMYALPLGYTYDSYMDRDTYEKMNEQEREEAILQSVLLEKNLPDYEKKNPAVSVREIPWEIKKANGVTWDGKNFFVKKKRASVTLHLKKKINNAETGLLVKGFDFKNKGKPRKDITVHMDLKSGERRKVRKTLLYLMPKHLRYIGRKDFLINFGWTENAKEEITIHFPRKGEYTIEELKVLEHPMDKYEDRIAARKENVLENMKMGANSITGQISLAKNKILCLAIPYSTGWTAWVDGEKTEILQANTMFMAVPLQKGNHQIVLTYRTPGLYLGAGFSLAGIILCVIIAVKRRFYKGINVI